MQKQWEPIKKKKQYKLNHKTRVEKSTHKKYVVYLSAAAQIETWCGVSEFFWIWAGYKVSLGV